MKWELNVGGCKLQVGMMARKVSRIWSDMVGFTQMSHEAVVKKSQKLYRFFTGFFTRRGRGWLDLVGFGWIRLDWVGLNGSDRSDW